MEITYRSHHGFRSVTHSARAFALLTLAAGPLRIYRVTSSNVSFLNSGTLLHTIFPRSQCWCVDGESVFVLRIRQDTYYRIELPFDSPEDTEKVEQFRKVLSQVLQYEKTRCPFTRGFETEIDQVERPKTPPRKPSRPLEKAKKWVLSKTWQPEDGPRPETPVRPSAPDIEVLDAVTESSYEDDDASSVCTDLSDRFSLLETASPRRPPVHRPSVPERARIFQEGMRSVTSPVPGRDYSVPMNQFTRTPTKEEAMERPKVKQSWSQKNANARPQIERNKSSGMQSFVSAVESFYSLENSAENSPSPEFLDAEAELQKSWRNSWAGERSEDSLSELESRGRSKHRRQTSEMTLRQPSETFSSEPVRNELPRLQAPMTLIDVQPVKTPTIEVRLSSAPSTPPLINDSDSDTLNSSPLDVATPPTAIRLRRRLTGATQKRAFSPMPHPQNLWCPPAHDPQRRLTSELIRRTAELVLGPPSHLVQLMLRIAAKIHRGVASFNTYRIRNAIPGSWGSWDSSESEKDDSADEDDYGIPLRKMDDAARRRAAIARDVD